MSDPVETEVKALGMVGLFSKMSGRFRCITQLTDITPLPQYLDPILSGTKS